MDSVVYECTDSSENDRQQGPEVAVYSMLRVQSSFVHSGTLLKILPALEIKSLFS